MIACLALIEGGIACEPIFVDIHVHMNQLRPDHARLNPNMTVPTLVLPGHTRDQSRDIAENAQNQSAGAGSNVSPIIRIRHYRRAPHIDMASAAEALVGRLAATKLHKTVRANLT